MKQLTWGFGDAFALTATASGVRAEIDDTWRGWSGPHGGVLAGLVIEVAAGTLAGPTPVRAMDMRFLGRPGTGAIDFITHRRRVGRTVTVVDVHAEQDGTPVLSGAVVFGTSTSSEITAGAPGAGGSGPGGRGGAPEVPSAAECPRFAIPAEIVPVGAHFDIRPAAGPLPLSGAGAAWMCAWIDLIPAAPISAPTLAVLADALPPAVFPTRTVPVAVPTVALSLQLHSDSATPVTGPVLVRATNTATAAGWSADETELWDEAGLLLATARQTRRVLG